MNSTPEKNATILLSDMIGFTKRTLKMNPIQVSNFLIDYRRELEHAIMTGKDRAQYFEHSGGDASASVFEAINDQNENRSVRAYQTAMHLIDNIKNGQIAPTRFGLYSGKVIEAKINNESFRFGNCFSAASRLLELCDYYDTPILMDRDVASAQIKDKHYIACIGKITPKSFDHPIHIYTTYKPGVHKIPADAPQGKLDDFIKIKNSSIDYLHGNEIKHIKPNFSKARQNFYRAARLFEEMTGHTDLASLRMLEFIEENTAPALKFISEGIKLRNKNGDASEKAGINRVGRELLRAFDLELYKHFVLETRWQKWFTFQWRMKNEVLFRIGDEPDGVYFITRGKVDVLDRKNRFVTQMGQGNVFGEMAYFSEEKKRNATVIARTDLELYFITEENFVRHPEISDLFERIAKYRALNPD